MLLISGLALMIVPEMVQALFHSVSSDTTVTGTGTTIPDVSGGP
jgi:hypothetical protein